MYKLLRLGQNGGTRTFECPAGGAGGADLKPTELEGNLLSKIGAEVFLRALESGAFPIAESTASSGRYPKMWDTPWWKEILARLDVAFVEFPMCAFGLGPMDEDGFYHHRTRLVFPRNEAVVAAFSRRCPGVGAAHRHVPLKGARPGQKVTRCTEAGVYAKDFVRTVVEVLQRVVQVGGEGDEANPPQRHRWGAEDARAGGVDLRRGQSVESDGGGRDDQAGDQRGGLDAKHAGWLHGLDEGDGDTHAEGRRSGLHAKQAGWLHELDEGHSDTHAGGRRGGLRAKQAGWLDELDDEEGDFLANTPVQGVVYGHFEDTRAGSVIDIAHRAPSEEAKGAAQDYIREAGAGKTGSPAAWKSMCECGGRLVEVAGSVTKAAESLWRVREEEGLNNLKKVDDESLDTVLHPDLLAYLRDVRRHGLAARSTGERKRCRAKVHPNGRRNLNQVYKQIWKDVSKLRVLVVPANLGNLGDVVSSPFDAVDKMLLDRSVAPDKRIAHDQRAINSGTDKEWHPPAVQPKHEQIARLVRAKSQLPGVEVLLSKKDIAGPFRLLWLDPRDAELFAGDMPWTPEEMEEGDAVDGTEMTVDNVLVEPWVGLRPWVASEVCEAGVQQLLGEAAVNREKDLMEGPFRTFQTVWGLDVETETEEVHLPERRVLKGALLLAEPCFEYGCKDLTLRMVQRFRGVATGWVVTVKGLKNELKAADRFLGTERDAGAKVHPKVQSVADTQEAEDAWIDLWELFESSRWLCSRPETWPQKFGAGLKELLPVRERLALRGEWDAGTVFVSSDATRQMIGAIDWTNGLVMRMRPPTPSTRFRTRATCGRQ